MANAQQHFATIMNATFLDQIIDGGKDGEFIGAMSANMVRGSLFNPLMALRLQCMDINEGMSYDAEALAAVLGVPAEWLEADRLVADADEVVVALGKLALVLLACQRNAAMAQGFEVEGREDALTAAAALPEVLRLNARLMAH